MIEYDPYAKLAKIEGEYHSITQYTRNAILNSHKLFTTLSKIEYLLNTFDKSTEEEFNKTLQEVLK